jgi:hypothetical protein
VRSDLCDSTVDAVNQDEKSEGKTIDAETKEQDVGVVDIARTIQEIIAQQKE